MRSEWAANQDVIQHVRYIFIMNRKFGPVGMQVDGTNTEQKIDILQEELDANNFRKRR